MSEPTLQTRLAALKLHGIIEHWAELQESQIHWLQQWVLWEEQERQRKSHERRLRQARLGRFKALADFDWQWPTQIHQQAIHDQMTLDFLRSAANLVLLGPNGVGKTLIAKNIALTAVNAGHTVLFTSAAQMLNDLAAKEVDSTLRRRLKYYAAPTLLVIDEVGYLSYGNRHADLLFEVINQRYELKSTLITTNRPFSEWGEVFPNAACVVSLIDRLVHHADIIAIEGESYRMKEAQERAKQKQKKRTATRKPTTQTPAE